MAIKKQKKTINALLIFIIISSLLALRFFYVKSTKIKKAYGFISAKNIDIRAQDSKKISKIYFKENDFVKKQDLLLEFDLTDVKAKIRHLKAKIDYENEKLTLLKFEEERSLETYLNSKKEDTSDIKEINSNLKKLEKNQLLYRIQNAKIAMLQSRLDILKNDKKNAYVYSPIDGQIVACLACERKTTIEKEKLFTISDEKDICLDIKMGKNHLKNFNLGDEFNISLNDFPNSKFIGKIFDIADDKNDFKNILLKLSINQIKNSPDEKTHQLISGMQAKIENE